MQIKNNHSSKFNINIKLIELKFLNVIAETNILVKHNVKLVLQIVTASNKIHTQSQKSIHYQFANTTAHSHLVCASPVRDVATDAHSPACECIRDHLAMGTILRNIAVARSNIDFSVGCTLCSRVSWGERSEGGWERAVEEGKEENKKPSLVDGRPPGNLYKIF